MGLLMMSDALLVDPMLKDAGQWHHSLTEYVYVADLARDSDGLEAAQQAEDPDSWRILLRWPQRLIASL